MHIEVTNILELDNALVEPWYDIKIIGELRRSLQMPEMQVKNEKMAIAEAGKALLSFYKPCRVIEFIAEQFDEAICEKIKTHYTIVAIEDSNEDYPPLWLTK